MNMIPFCLHAAHTVLDVCEGICVQKLTKHIQYVFAFILKVLSKVKKKNLQKLNNQKTCKNACSITNGIF